MRHSLTLRLARWIEQRPDRGCADIVERCEVRDQESADWLKPKAWWRIFQPHLGGAAIEWPVVSSEAAGF